MDVAAKAGIKAVRVLDSIMSVKLKNDPTMLAVWKTAQHVVRDPVRKSAGAPVQAGVLPSGAPNLAKAAMKDGSEAGAPETELLVPRTNGSSPLVA
jgi:hypothetical protein